MKFSTLAFLLSLLVALQVQETTCFNEHIMNKLIKQRLDVALSQSASPSPSTSSKRSGRVLYPGDYGADPTGTSDSSDAILKAFEDAFKMGNGEFEMMPGIKDLGGIVLDLQGGNYKISKPITLPSNSSNIVVKGGTLRASDTFPTDRHLIELWSPNSHKLPKPTINDSKLEQPNFGQPTGIYYEDITFREILFDSSYRAGGIFVVDSARIRINNCFFLHFNTEGILVQSGHEAFISSCFLGQHSTVGGDKGERNFSGTAIDLASNDNAITDVAIFSAAIGIILRGQANMITGVHCYNKATGFGGIGILVKLAGKSQTRIDNCYMDWNSIVMEDPVQLHVTNGFFLGDGNIVLKSIKGKVSGLNIVNNMFTGNPNSTVPIVTLDGQFSDIDQVVIDKNNVVNMTLRSTVGKLAVVGKRSKWIADFSDVLIFPNRISHFQYSFYSQEKGKKKFVAHSVTNVSNNVVVVESKKPVQGVVSFFVEQ